MWFNDAHSRLCRVRPEEHSEQTSHRRVTPLKLQGNGPMVANNSASLQLNPSLRTEVHTDGDGDEKKRASPLISVSGRVQMWRK